jgi:hypothetical protein
MKSMGNARQVVNDSYFGLTLRDRTPAIFTGSVLPFSTNFSSFIVQRQLRRSLFLSATSDETAMFSHSMTRGACFDGKKDNHKNYEEPLINGRLSAVR